MLDTNKLLAAFDTVVLEKFSTTYKVIKENKEHGISTDYQWMLAANSGCMTVIDDFKIVNKVTDCVFANKSCKYSIDLVIGVEHSLKTSSEVFSFNLSDIIHIKNGDRIIYSLKLISSHSNKYFVYKVFNTTYVPKNSVVTDALTGDIIHKFSDEYDANRIKKTNEEYIDIVEALS